MIQPESPLKGNPNNNKPNQKDPYSVTSAADFHPPQKPLPPEIVSPSLLLHLLPPYLLRIEIGPSPRPMFWPFLLKSPKGNTCRKLVND